VNKYNSGSADPEIQRRAWLMEGMGLGPYWQERQPQSQPAQEVEEVRGGQGVQGVQEEPRQVEPVQAEGRPAVQVAVAAKAVQQARPEPVAPSYEDEPDMPPPPDWDSWGAEDLSPVPQAVPVVDAMAERAAAIAAMDWDALEQSVAGCRACGLCEGRAKTVFGVGDRKAKWLFIGEGPGYNENLQGEPFVGAAGRLLDNMMRALDMQRGEGTFIANVVKCRPTDAQGKDRPPTLEEAQACLPYLQRQIALIQPKVMVALGKTAAVSLLGLDMETPVGQLRGKLHRYQNVPMAVTYHPAYLLRKPVEKSKAWADLCLAAKAAES
jgi:DNA polymerase